MSGFFAALFGTFVSWWGVFTLAALDTSVLVFLPFGIDAVVVILVARHQDLWWLPPVLGTLGSLVGGGATFWLGHRVGEPGLEHFTGSGRLDAIKRRVRKRGAAMALTAVFPPPFPLTPFVLASGALDVSRTRFFALFGAVRLARYGIEAGLAVRYGQQLIGWMHSDAFKITVGAFIVVAVGGTGWSAWRLWQQTRHTRRAAA